VNKFGGVSGVEIIVQSDKSPGYLNKRIENFLNNTKVFESF
jgi:secreted Zn-dependent insulinase-like peptidase